MRRASYVLLASALLALVLASCGGGDDSSSSDTSVSSPTESTATTPSTERRGGTDKTDKQPGGQESTPSQGGGDHGRAPAEKPASLATDPDSIAGAVVTSAGAVQTLPSSAAAQEEAMENSYSSIKAFGAESTGSEATDITFALVQYLTAKANGDWATACARIYSVLRANLEKDGKSCPETYGELMSRASAASRAEAAKIDVAAIRRGDDNRAFVIYKTPATLSADMPMYLDQGIWTVGALAAYTLTPEQLEAGE
jgi:hypothetical protein